MLSYKGSGKRWKSHIKQHGKEHVVTLWYQLYDNVFDLVADALSMSKSFDIVCNNSWLNLIPENGLDGTLSGINSPNFGLKRSDEFKLNISKMNSGSNNRFYNISPELHPMFGKTHSDETKLKMSASKLGENNANFGKPRSDDFKKKLSTKMKGRSQSKEQISNQSHHFDFCINSEYTLLNITLRQLCELLSLNYDSARTMFKSSNKYKNITKLRRVR